MVEPISMSSRGLWVFAVLASVLTIAAAAFAVQAFTGGSREISIPSVESGALPHLAAADASAAAWREDAYLTRVLATEGKLPGGISDPPLLYDTTPDPLVGNALAVVWTFVYASPSEPGMLFFASLGGDGSVLYQRAITDPSMCCVAYAVSHDGSFSPAPMPAPVRLARPTLDAADAFARVADRPEFANFSADHPTFMAFLHLAPGEDDKPIWNIGYRTATIYSAHATVDATTGDVLDSGGWPRVEPPCCETPPDPPTPTPPVCCRPDDYHEEFSLRLGASRSSEQVHFPVDGAAWLRDLTVTVTPQSVLPFDEVEVRLTDGYGRALARDGGSGPMAFSFGEVPGDGVYSVQLWTSGVPLRDIPVGVTVDVTYDETARLPPMEHRFQDSLSGFGSEAYFPLWFGYGDAVARVSLSWSPNLPLDTLELVLVDGYGNEVAVVQDSTGSVDLDVPERECCYTVLVRNAGRTLSEIPFELLVEMAPSSVEVGHAHATVHSEPGDHGEHVH